MTQQVAIPMTSAPDVATVISNLRRITLGDTGNLNPCDSGGALGQTVDHEMRLDESSATINTRLEEVYHRNLGKFNRRENSDVILTLRNPKTKRQTIPIFAHRIIIQDSCPILYAYIYGKMPKKMGVYRCPWPDYLNQDTVVVHCILRYIYGRVYKTEKMLQMEICDVQHGSDDIDELRIHARVIVDNNKHLHIPGLTQMAATEFLKIMSLTYRGQPLGAEQLGVFLLNYYDMMNTSDASSEPFCKEWFNDFWSRFHNVTQ